MAQILSEGGVKPTPWNIRGPRDPRIREEWRWAWEGLQGAWLFWEGAGPTRDLVAEADASDIGSSATWQRRRYGRYRNYGGSGLTTGETTFGSTTLFMDGNQQFTVLALARVPPGNDDGYIFARAGGTGSERVFGLWESSDDLRYYARGNSGLSESSGGWNDGNWHTYAIRWDGDTGTTGQYVRDGGVVTDPVEVGSASDGDFALTFGQREGGWQATNMDMALGLVWDRHLSLDELAEIDRDPFGPFRPRERDVVQVSLAAIDNDRLADMGFCRGAAQYGPGRLPVPDGTIG